MIFTTCKNSSCRKLIALDSDSIDSLKRESAYVTCVHCGHRWTVQDLFEHESASLISPEVFVHLEKEIISCTSTADICKRISDWSEMYGIDGLIIMEYANMIIGEKQNDQDSDIEMLNFVKLDTRRIPLDNIEHKNDEAFQKYSILMKSDKVIITKDSQMDAQIEKLQVENEQIKRQNEILSEEVAQLKMKLKRYL